MSLDEVDPVLLAPKRLAAVGILAASTTAEFAFLREHLGVSDSDLSKQMAALLDAGYVAVRKTGRAAQRRTWYRLTSDGRAALHRHVAALNALVDAAPTATTAPDGVDPFAELVEQGVMGPPGSPRPSAAPLDRPKARRPVSDVVSEHRR